MTTNWLEHLKSWIRLEFLSTGVLIFFIENVLPKNERPLWSIQLVLYQLNLDTFLHYCTVILCSILVFAWPTIQPSLIIGLILFVDSMVKFQNTRFRKFSSIMPFFLYVLTFFQCKKIWEIEQIREIVEQITSFNVMWGQASILMALGSLYRPRKIPSNSYAFIPEGIQGIKYALIFWSGLKYLPFPALLIPWCVLTFPQKWFFVDFTQWIVLTWFWYKNKLSPQIMYILYLFINHWPYQEFWLRLNGGQPSVILSRQRIGITWFILTSLFVSVAEKYNPTSTFRILSTILNPKIWSTVFVIIAIREYVYGSEVNHASQSYTYKPLRSKTSIRLLRLQAQPNLSQSSIRCDMIQADLACLPAFVAVSHFANDTVKDKTIYVDGSPLPVSSTIYNLLKSKISSLNQLILYINTTCVNEEDANEIVAQQKISRDIYEKASSVTLCIDGDNSLEKAFDFLEILNELPHEEVENFRRKYLLQNTDYSITWKSFEKLVDHECFQSFWAIQAFTLQKDITFQIGSREVTWSDVTDGLLYAITTDASNETTSEFAESRGLFNILLLESIRIQVRNADYLRLQDILKMMMRFNKNFLNEQVYNLLNICEEVYIPYVRPRYYKDFTGITDFDSNKRDILSMKLQNIQDFTINTRNEAEIVRDTVNSKRSKQLVLSYEQGVRNASTILHYSGKLSNNTQIGKRENSVENFRDEIQRIISNESQVVSLEKLYIMAAKISLENEGHPLSFLPSAGITNRKESRNIQLPSWIPDWSMESDTFNITSHTKKLNNSISAAIKGSNFTVLDLKATYVGRIEHFVPLTRSFGLVESTNNPPEIADVLKMTNLITDDASNLIKIYHSARSLAIEYAKSRHNNEAELTEVFYRTTCANRSMDDPKNSATSEDIDEWRKWTQGVSIECPILTLMASAETSFDISIKSVEAQETKRLILQKYLRRRRLHSSSNSRFAHLIRSNIVPSFSQYRIIPPKRQIGDKEDIQNGIKEALKTENGKVPNLNSNEMKESNGMIEEDDDEFETLSSEEKRNRVINMLQGNEGPLYAYKSSIDYGMNRNFAITDNGYMALVPRCTQKGDLLINVAGEDKTSGASFVFRHAKCPEDLLASEVLSTDNKSEIDVPTPKASFTGILIGESYVHSVASEYQSQENTEWFRFW